MAPIHGWIPWKIAFFWCFKNQAMRVSILQEELSKEALRKLPFPFCKEYADFEKGRGFSYYILSDEKKEIFIPLKVSKRQIFYVAIFTHAPVKINDDLSPVEEKEFISAAADLCAKQLKCIRIEPGSTISAYHAFPDNATAVELGIFSINLLRTEEEIFADFNPKYRTQIRKAESQGIDVRYGRNEIGAFYECYAHTHDRQGAAHENLAFFEDMYDALGEDKTICCTAYANGMLESGTFIVFNDYAGYYMYAGSAEKTLMKGSTRKILWECMKVMKQRGSAKFVLGGARYKNVEGTKFEQIQDFKRRFGAEIKDGYIWKKDLNPAMCKLYDFLFWLRCRLRGNEVPKDIVDSQL
ncbi:MAG TPA: peptidoglycan bridge formation glycyltransferase FemA/FemB family protein [Chitinophagales bacterium]|nr:peptidoglycan bridge formation glycyltransferase FemA/FemB family protein [Chitinophagales bacterium]